jgi:predicted 3-demethylubiquinone-9 3-methyltransferase (glyoxalase superfamily)
VHGRPPGSVMTVVFELDGCAFTALNGGPLFQFNEAVSLQIQCDTQEEIDFYWSKLSEGGDPEAQQCGLAQGSLRLSWQVVPTVMPDLIGDPDPEKAARVMEAMLPMKKLDLAKLKQAHSGTKR